MKDLEFTFDRPAWELAIGKLRKGDTVSAVRLLALLESEDETAVEDALTALEDNGITLETAELLKDYGTGQTENRLRWEEKLSTGDSLLESLEENDPLRLYLQEIAGIPAVGDPEVLAQRSAQGDETAIPQLVNLTIGKAITIAREMTGRGVLLLDLIQEASMGLWQGILCYTEGDFDSHIDWWIRQYLAKAVFLQARASGVGQKMRAALELYRQTDERLLTMLGRNPTMEEIAADMGISPEEAEIYEDTLRSARLMERVKQPPKEESAEDEQAVENTAYFQSRQRIQEMLSTLTEVEAQVLTLRFGLDNGIPCSPQETGAKLSLTAGEVVQIETAALTKLRK